MTKRTFRLFSFIFILAAGSSIPPLFSALSTRNTIPDFGVIKKWVGTSSPITKKSLEGKVTVLSFVSPTDSRSLWELDVLSEWYKTYSPTTPFDVIAVAQPEFNFQKNQELFEAQILRLKLPFPVALDSEKSLYLAYNPRTLPAHVVIDAKGNVRKQYSGDFSHATMEEYIRTLFRETSLETDISSLVDKTIIPNFPGHSDLFLGWKNPRGFGNTEKLISESPQNFTSPSALTPYKVYARGRWTSHEENLSSSGPGAELKIAFSSFRVGIVAGALKKGTIAAEIRIDGQPVTKAEKGKDIIFQEGRSYCLIRDYRFYRLINTKNKSGVRTIEIIFEEPGAQIFKVGFN